MKTNPNKKEIQKQGLKSRPEQVITGKTLSREQAKEKVSFWQIRKANRELRKEAVLDFLQSQLPQQYAVAEIVGRWIWLESPKDRVRVNALIKLGFHWNRRRQVWQHPGGAFADFASHPGDPREKYGSHFPAQFQPA